MSWTTSVTDVRKILSDGSTDKLCYRKQVIGVLNSSNVSFKSFEIRRVSSFVAATAPIGVYKNGVAVTVSADDLPSGEFTLAAAPADGDSLRATYYVQWFNDDELQQFLVGAGQWIGVGDDYTQISENLRPAAKEYAAALAYQKLVARFALNLSETYQLYDAPDQKRFDPIQAYMKISESKMKLAFQLRDDVYKNRQGRALAPLSGVISGRVPDVPPDR